MRQSIDPAAGIGSIHPETELEPVCLTLANMGASVLQALFSMIQPGEEADQVISSETRIGHVQSRHRR